MMNELFSKQLNDLKAALLDLPATGETGFEGLIAVTLTAISGVPFRLASSGSQFGVDARAAYDRDSICFECKRYGDTIPRNEVLSKVAELSISDTGSTDLWVLGATSPVRSQLADAVRKLGAESGISILIIDWSGNVPPLAVASAMTEGKAAAFLAENLTQKGVAAKAAAALDGIRDSEGFAEHAARIRSELEEPSTGIGLARRANIKWLTEVFSDRQKAKRFIGQPLSPLGTGAAPLTRSTLVSQIMPYLTSKPDGTIVTVLGEEGNGKSWYVAQSWLSLEEGVVMIVLTPDDFIGVSPADDMMGLLIRKLEEQSGNNLSPKADMRWRRKMKRWRARDVPDAPRFVVFIDGLNQRPNLDWARLIEALVSNLADIGGRLIVTVRTSYFYTSMKPRLHTASVEITVPEWTESERDEILATHGIRGSDLRESVAASLENPRLLGIALALFQSAQIRDMDELGPDRLLFEHMRMSERDSAVPQPAQEFAGKLRKHANKILSRIAEKQRNDLKVFDVDLEAVSDGRFFVPLAGDPTRYTLAEDGLTLALAFSLLDQLRIALRNERDIDATLETMIEPISALDRTAQVMLAALTVACLDKDYYPADLTRAIVIAFTDIQNPDNDDFDVFASLAREHPEAFMGAAHRLCLAGAQQPNIDWVEAALLAARTYHELWTVISDQLRSWLDHYSLKLERGMFSHPSNEPAEKVNNEIERREKVIDERLAALSRAELDLLDSLTEKDDGNLSKVAHFAFTLLAGTAITPFVPALVKWRFANALNPESNGRLYAEFTHLVRFNRIDWPDARERILAECLVFEGPDVSTAGKWALFGLLQATGDASDAVRAKILFEELTTAPYFPKVWRLVEVYCAADPCDPGSVRPANISDTAKKYREIDVSKLRLGRGSSSEDHFFSMARPGLVQFAPDAAIGKHKEFLTDVLGRDGFSLRQGLFELRRDNALFTRDEALVLVNPVSSDMSKGNDGTLRELDQWIVSQYRALLAFPRLTAKEQIDILLSQDHENGFLLDLLAVAKPLDSRTFEALLEKAMREDDEHAQYCILAFGGSADTVISDKSLPHLGSLVSSDSKRVRAAVLALIARCGDDELIDTVVQSGWSAAKLGEDDDWEVWYGSAVILKAAEHSLVSSEEALDRIAPQFYGQAARKLNAAGVSRVAERIDISIRKAANQMVDPGVPDIEMHVQNEGGTGPTLYSASEKPSGPVDSFEDVFKRFSESEEAFDQRQRRAHEAFKAFKAKLTERKARIILDDLRINEFDAIAELDRSFTESWHEMFMNLPDKQLMAVHNLGLLLAHALAGWNPTKASELFERLSGSQHFVRIAFGLAGLPLDVMAPWAAADDPALNTLRFERIDRTASDNELAYEVLAALQNGKETLLQEYMEQRIATGEPERIARALMVAGLSMQNVFSDELLAGYREAVGFIGSVRAAAMYAYERNI